jgi:flagella basal body P-ring formation protein FlgA
MTISRHLTARRKQILAWPVLLLSVSNGAHAEAMTHPDQLIDAARSFLEQAVDNYLQRSAIDGRREIHFSRLDPRLRLAYCDAPLSAQLESPDQPVGRVTLRVSCSGSSPWSVFVPAQVKLYRKVLVTNKALQRGAALGDSDISEAERDISLLTQGYLTTPAQVAGTKLTRIVQPGQVLTPAMLELAEVIRRGDQVVISAGNQSVNVRMPGEALTDGAPGEQIRVKNLRSGRIVRARVTGPGQVEAAM